METWRKFHFPWQTRRCSLLQLPIRKILQYHLVSALFCQHLFTVRRLLPNPCFNVLI